MSANGYRRDESGLGDLGPAEQPTLLAAVDLLESSGTSREALADLAGLPVERVDQLAAGDSRPSVRI